MGATPYAAWVKKKGKTNQSTKQTENPWMYHLSGIIILSWSYIVPVSAKKMLESKLDM